MGPMITDLLTVHTWRAFDVDDDGRVLAGSDETGSTQLVEVTPGRDGEAPTITRLTALPGACSGRYLPGDRAVIVQHDAGGNERAQLSVLRLDQPPVEPVGIEGLEPVVHNDKYVHQLLDVLPGRVVYSTNRRNDVDFDVVVHNVFVGEEEPIYADGGMVQEAAIAPDSRYLAVTVPGLPADSTQLLLVDTMPETPDVRVFPVTEADELTRLDHLRWLPDSSGLIATTDRERDLARIARYDLTTEQWTDLVTSAEHELCAWPSPDGALLLVETNVDGVARLAVHDATDGGHRYDVATPGNGWISYPMPEPQWSPNSRFVALSFSSPTVPGDVLLLDTSTGQVARLTDSAHGLGEALIEPSSHRVPAHDGESIPCAVYRSAAPAASAVLVLHGGPAAQAVRRFDPVVQALAAAGHTVLVPNIRGSAGYGKRWRALDDGRLRLESLDDLLALHDWLPELDVDPARVALYGGSYGGYLVLAGLAFQPDRWAAGVDIVGMSSLVTFLENTAPYRRGHREREYGSLEDDQDFLEQASPLNRVDAISAPVFVIHGANDPRVPLSEAEQIATSLRAKGIECELAVYADEGHGLAKRSNRLDAYPQVLDFLARHLGDR